MMTSTEVFPDSVSTDGVKVSYTVEVPKNLETEAWLLMIPGWIADETMMADARHLVAQKRRQRAVTMSHARRGNLSEVSKQHSQNCLAVMGAISLRAGSPQKFHMLGHSHGGVDAAYTAYALPRNSSIGKIEAIGYDASVGLNGKIVTPQDVITAMPSMTADSIKTFWRNPLRGWEVGWHALFTMASNPRLIMEEGHYAAHADIRPLVGKLLTRNIVQTEFYYQYDVVVPPPQKEDITIYEGLGHWGPLVEPAVVVHSAEHLEKLSSEFPLAV